MSPEEIPSGHSPSEPAESADRRSFFGIVAGFLQAGVALFLAIPAYKYILHPAFEGGARDDNWSEVGSFSDLPVGEPQNRTFVQTQHDGWAQRQVEKSVWIVRYPDDSARVYSAVCPHLGCTINWKAETKNFHCACHNSSFSFLGERLGGPAPRGMDRLEYRVESGALLVKSDDTIHN